MSPKFGYAKCSVARRRSRSQVVMFERCLVLAHTRPLPRIISGDPEVSLGGPKRRGVPPARGVVGPAHTPIAALKTRSMTPPPFTHQPTDPVFPAVIFLSEI